MLGANYTKDQVKPYVSPDFTVRDYLVPYVQAQWQAGMPDCSINFWA